jgi:hypothetical protein
VVNVNNLDILCGKVNGVGLALDIFIKFMLSKGMPILFVREVRI